MTYSNQEMNDIMKIVQALEDFNILLNGVTKTIKNKTKEQKGGFLSMLIGTLEASLSSHSLTNFEIQKYYQNEPRFNGVYSKNNLTEKNKGWGIHNKP